MSTSKTNSTRHKHNNKHNNKHNKFVFTVKCPYCGNLMLYSSKTRFVKGKRKKCVFCGHSFEVSKHIVGSKDEITREFKRKSFSSTKDFYDGTNFE